MALEINFSDATNLNLYAILFSAKDPAQAFRLSTSQFESFGNSQSVFAMTLSENASRSGFYSLSISDVSSIVATKNDESYTIEVWQRAGSTPNRSNDSIIAISTFFWDGEKEIDLSQASLASVSENTWNEENRSLTEAVEVSGGVSTPEEIATEVWSAEKRNLTDDVDVSDESIADIAAAANPPKVTPTINAQTPRLLGNQ